MTNLSTSPWAAVISSRVFVKKVSAADSMSATGTVTEPAIVRTCCSGDLSEQPSALSLRVRVRRVAVDEFGDGVE